MAMAERIQRKRTKGWRMPEGAVYVGRGSPWGNPYRLDDLYAYWNHIIDPCARAQACVDHYRRMVMEGFVTVPYTILTPAERGDHYHSVGAHHVYEVAAKYLRGKDLVCWCRCCAEHANGKPLGVACDDCAPCHADVLLELANR